MVTNRFSDVAYLQNLFLGSNQVHRGVSKSLILFFFVRGLLGVHPTSGC